MKGVGVTPEERMVGMTEEEKANQRKDQRQKLAFHSSESAKEDKERSGLGSPVLSGN